MRKIISLFISFIFVISGTACMQEPTRSDTRGIEELLAEKYNAEFEVVSIENNSNDFPDDNILAYCCPKDNKRAVFEAVISPDNKLVSDSYYKTMLEAEARGIIEERFLSSGIEVTTEVNISRLSEDYDLSGKSLSQVISDCPTISLTFITILDNKARSDVVYDTASTLLNEFYNGSSEMFLSMPIWRYYKSDYEKCASGMNNTLPATKNYFENNHPLSKVSLSIIDGEIDKGLDDFSSSFNSIKLRGDFK